MRAVSGYTPLFDSLTKGTLCGRWPDIGLWPIVLSMSDKYGIVDVHPNAISGLTGLPLDEVVACMARFCEPDPMSRSTDADGARLVFLDAHRDWGWRVVNHTRYREKARKSAFDAARVEDGRNAARMADRRRPDVTRDNPPSNSNANSNLRSKRATKSPLEKKSVDNRAALRQKVAAMVQAKTFR